MPPLERLAKPAVIVGISILIIAASFGGGVYVGYERRPAIEKVKAILNQETAKPEAVDFSQFWEVWARLEDKYVDRADIQRAKLVEGAIAGLVKSLGDPYTVFLPPQQAKQFREDVRGQFGGIGAEIGIRKDVLTIIAPLAGSPAERVGLKAGDKVLKINATSTADLTLEEAVGLIRGEVGTKVTLTIARDSLDDGIKDFTITRDVIIIPTVNSEARADDVFYIRLHNFNENAPQEFRQALVKYLGSQDHRIILDLRGNPGGFLDAAVQIASWFIPAGEPVAREKFADGSEVVYRSTGHRLLEKTPVVVLIDQGSASAAEILAGALRDVNGIKLVGEKTFGKGSVQQVDNLHGGASLKITVAKWLTPKGASINDKGLEPDIVIKNEAETRDLQLEKALEVVKSLPLETS